MLPARSRPRTWFLAAGLLACLVVVAHRPARAEDAKATSALAMVPADAAFFSSSLRWAEQVNLFYKSKAYKALRALPSVKKAYSEAMAKLKDKDGPIEQLEKFRKTDLGKDVETVLTEAVSSEVFVYGGKAWITFFELLNLVNNSQSFAPLTAALTGNDPNKAQGRAILHVLLKNKAMIKVPEIVLGFKLDTPKKAAALLDKAEKIVSGLVVGVKELEDRVKPRKIAGSKFITLELDGSLLPLKDIDLTDVEEKKGEFDDLIKHIEKAKLTVALGVSESYLLLSVGEGTRDLEALSAKGKKLHDIDALAPFRKAGDRKFTSIGYMSKELAGAGVESGKAGIDNFLKASREALKAADLKEERKKAIAKDLDELAKDMTKADAPQPGAQLAFSYLTASGYEAYAYDNTKYPNVDKVKFNLHKHFGGSPIFAAAFGARADGSTYRETTKLARKAWVHIEAILLDSLDMNTADEYKKQMKIFLPLLQKLDDTTTKLFLPSIEQTGLGIVLDSKWKSKQWVTSLPAFDKEMPAPELGLLIGVSDGKKFVSAMSEYRKTLNEIFSKLREVPGLPDVPDFSIPAPETEKGDDGPLAWWPFGDIGLDKQFQLTVGTGKSAAVLALSKKHVQRLAKETELKFRDKDLAFSGEALGCCVLDWVGLIDLITPWVEYSIEQAAKDLGDGDKKAAAQGKKWAKEAATALMIFKSFKGSTCTTRLVDGVIVSKSVIVFRDLEAMPDPLD